MMSMGLVDSALANLRGDWRRSAAAAMAILVATTSFVVLTGTVRTQQLRVTEQVADNYRSTYDILVRPHGSASDIERAEGVVRPNFLSGQYGGIALDQVQSVREVPGVEIAAPVAVLGQTMRSVLTAVDVRSVLGNQDRAMVRFQLTGSARNGTGVTTNQSGYLYLTRNELTSVDPVEGPVTASSPELRERRNGRVISACLASDAGGAPSSPAGAFDQRCWSARTDRAVAPRVEVLFSMPLTVAAVDPEAEARLTGLDRAIIEGRGLTDTDSFSTDSSGPAPVEAATAVMAAALPLDFRATLSVDEIPEAVIDKVLATKDAQRRRTLVQEASAVRTVARVERDAAETYRRDIAAQVDTTAGRADPSLFMEALNQPGDVRYSQTNPLAPQVVAFDPAVWRPIDNPDVFFPLPPSATDTGYRQVKGQPKTARDKFVSFKIVGKYDPDRLPRLSELNEVPLETYRSSYLEGADASSRAVLGDNRLLSDLNPSGYVQPAPALLVPLQALPMFWESFGGLSREAPVSSIRVRVSGVAGMGVVERERIRQVADQIHTRTGLDVDITIGASLQNRQVQLPATDSGTPALLLNERWTKKGVAVAISDALDIKSLILFVIILASSALTVALIATASVNARRRELATLACLGWRPGSISALISLELAILGIASGVLGALVAWPVAAVFGVDVPWLQVTLAVPLGALLALLPGLAATLLARRVTPMDAFRPPDRGRSRSRAVLSGPATLGLIMMLRRPGRALLGGLAIVFAVAPAVILANIVSSFNGAVVGSFLGDAVALQVRGPDTAAAVLLAVLGLTAVATVLTLSLFEDAPSYAVLQAVGWSDRALGLALLTQAAIIGLVGSTFGVAMGLGFISSFLGPVDAGVAAVGAAVASAAVALSALVAVLPATLLNRLPTARILARD